MSRHIAKALFLLFERCAVEEYPTSNGPAAYALVIDSQVMGIVEAKKLTLGPQNVLSQAQRYSRGIHQATETRRSTFRPPQTAAHAALRGLLLLSRLNGWIFQKSNILKFAPEPLTEGLFW